MKRFDVNQYQPGLIARSHILEVIKAFLWMLIFGCLISANAQHGQLQLNTLVNPNPSPYLSDWETDPGILQVAVRNTSETDIFFHLRAEIYGSRNGLVASGQSFPLHQQAYSQMILAGPQMLDWRSVKYNFALASQALQTGRIPEDEYQICLTALAEDGRELGRDCADFFPTSYQPSSLIAPLDGEESNLPTLNFLWAPHQTVSRGKGYYRLTIAEVYPGQTPQEALLSNLPAYQSAPLSANLLTLERESLLSLNLNRFGRSRFNHFAWQVQALDRHGFPIGENEGKSEIWTFLLMMPGDEGGNEGQDEEKCKHSTIKTEWGDWHQDQDGTEWREGKIIEECTEPGSPHGKKEIGTVREERKKDKKGNTTTTTTEKDGKGKVKKVIKEEKDRGGKTKKKTTTEYEYDDKGNLKGVKETLEEGKKSSTTEWKKEGNKWYKKVGDKWVEDPAGPPNLPK